MRISDWSSDVCSSDLGILFLTSRVRLLDPSGSFDTSSNHRLVDSQGGRAGQWVEIEVRGDYHEANLTMSACLAQAAQTRPLIARRLVSLARHAGMACRACMMAHRRRSKPR